MENHDPIYSDLREPFWNRAGTDQKLTWTELEASPLKIEHDGKDQAVPISKQEFQKAQNLALDRNPHALNWEEFKALLATKNIYHSKTYCDADVIPPHSRLEADVRQAVRKGISSEIKRTWPAQRKQIQQDLKDQELARVLPALQDYIASVARSAHHSNPGLEDLCHVACVVSLYEIEEFASPVALKDSAIKGFWKDVGKLLESLLSKTEGTRYRKHWYSRVWKKGWDCRKVYFFSGMPSPSNYTLKQLVQRTNPQLVKRIENMLSAIPCPRPLPV